MTWMSALRSRLRLVSGLVLFGFVLSHLVGHIVLLVSIDLGETVQDALMAPWRSVPGTVLLGLALLLHYGNALWSIYVRRSLWMSWQEITQLSLGLLLPVLLMLHIMATIVVDIAFDVDGSYRSVLISHWIGAPWIVPMQLAAVIATWVHACIGLNFWLGSRRWYRRTRTGWAALALLIPSLAIAGYVAAGNEVRRQIARDPGLEARVLAAANVTPEARASANNWTEAGIGVHLMLVLAAFGARWIRETAYRRGRLPVLTCPDGRRLPIRPGATVLETLRDHGVPHAAVCGGRARCTTCRVLVTSGAETLPPPDVLEARALARARAEPLVRLACQIAPAESLSIVPLLAADASDARGAVKGSFAGSERLVTVMFVDLRDSTRLSETRLPYDVLFLLNQFFREMTQALDDTGGHYSQFTGDGLMALYGLEGQDPKAGAVAALHGARQMLRRLAALNEQLTSEIAQPLRIGIGIHFSEAIVGAMGPPNSQILTAIGDTVNTCARLESLTKDYSCAVIISRTAAEAAGLDLSGHDLREAAVKGRRATVQFYALNEVPDLTPA